MSAYFDYCDEKAASTFTSTLNPGFNAPKSLAGVFHVAKYKKKASLAAHPSRHREYNRSGHAAAEIVEMPNTFYQGILRLVKAASLLQRPFDDKKDALVTKTCQGRPFSRRKKVGRNPRESPGAWPARGRLSYEATAPLFPARPIDRRAN